MTKTSSYIFGAVLVLLLFGLLPMMSASHSFSYKTYGDSFYLFNKQAVFAGIGLVLLITFAVVPYDAFRRFSSFLLICALFTVFALYFYASEIKGAKRSLPLFGFSYQPIEFLKIAIIYHLSSMLTIQGEKINDLKRGLPFVMFWVIISAGLIFKLPNVSNAMMIIIIALSLLYISRFHILKFFGLATSLISIALTAALFVPHAKARLLSFYNQMSGETSLGFQVKQSMISIGSGGLYGLGAGKSNQSNLFLPEAWGDFIFGIIAEEWGFIVSVLLLLLYFTVFMLGMSVSKACKDTFGKYLAFGISVSFILYAFINILVATGELPTTGLPLPFISQGGSSLIALCISFGILINIARYNEKQPEDIPEAEPAEEEI